MVPVYADIHVNTNNLAGTAKQVRSMADNFESGKILDQLTAFEGYYENGVPNNFFENIRLVDEYEKDLKTLAERLDEAVKHETNE